MINIKSQAGKPNSAQTGTVAADGQTITVLTDKDGRASVRPIAGENPGIVKIISEAVLPNNAVAGQAMFQLSILERKSGPTKFRGVVMNHTGKPLAGVRLSIARTNLSATSDSNGKFEFADQVPPGKIDLFVNGRTVTPTANIEYPALHFEIAIIPGQDNQLPHAIYLPPVNLSSSQIVGGNQDVTLTIPGYEGFELIVKANSVTFPDGSHTGPLVVSPVHNDRLPMVPPGGAATFGTLGWTIQPTGTRFDPPAQVKIPNPGNMSAGQTASIVQWDHDLATFVPMGRGTVSEDASQIVTDFGSGITKAGWGGCLGPACPPDLGFPQCLRDPPSSCRGGQCSACGECRRSAGTLACGFGLQCLPDLNMDNKPCTGGLCFLGICVPMDIEVVSADIKTDEIMIKVTPENVPGGTLKITLIRDDGEFVALDETSVTGERTVSFKLSDIPKGDYVRIKAVYSIGEIKIEDTRPYRFNVIGMVRHTQYGPVNEADCAGASDFSISLTSPPPNLRPNDPCGQVAGTLKRTFVNRAQINGVGLSTNYGLVQKEALVACGANPAPVAKWRRVTAAALRGAGRTVLNANSVAVGVGRGLGYDDSILIVTSNGPIIKTVDDKCPDCTDPNNDGGQDNHIDNFKNPIPNCSAGIDIGNLKTIKLID